MTDSINPSSIAASSPSGRDEPKVSSLSADAPSEALIESVNKAFGKELLQLEINHNDIVIRLTKNGYANAAKIVNEQLDCDYLSFVSAIDFLPMPIESEEGSGDTSQPAQPREQTVGVGGGETRFQVFTHVQSTTKHFGLTIKVDVGDDPTDAENFSVASFNDVFPGADWHERETWEMYGIDFVGHPEIRHLYLPGEFEGFPLRKDFPLLARVVKPWPGLTDVEPMPGEENSENDEEAGE